MTALSAFKNQLRLRVCGVLVEKSKLLLVNLRSPVTDQMIWMPPGGGVQFGESITDALKREFKEETQVDVEVNGLLHIEELIERDFHVVECYFEVSRTAGEPRLGYDPELANDQQILHDIAWLSLSDVPEHSFAPRKLLPKLLDWQNRNALKDWKSYLL